MRFLHPFTAAEGRAAIGDATGSITCPGSFLPLRRLSVGRGSKPDTCYLRPGHAPDRFHPVDLTTTAAAVRTRPASSPWSAGQQTIRIINCARYGAVAAARVSDGALRTALTLAEEFSSIAQ